MFIGHFAVSLAAKSARPRIPLATLIFATMFLDVLWPVFILLGVEGAHIQPGYTAASPLAFDSYPWSHSLVMSLVWGLAVGLLYRASSRDAAGAWWVGAVVFSHWVLDWVSHRPDLQIAPGLATRVGLGLWNSVPATIAVECAMFALGVGLYLWRTRARDRVGSIAMWAFFAFLLVLYFSNASGPPPPSIRIVAIFGIVAWVVIPWTSWFDRHREVRVAS